MSHLEFLCCWLCETQQRTSRNIDGELYARAIMITNSDSSVARLMRRTSFSSRGRNLPTATQVVILKATNCPNSPDSDDPLYSRISTTHAAYKFSSYYEFQVAFSSAHTPPKRRGSLPEPAGTAIALSVVLLPRALWQSMFMQRWCVVS